MDHRTSTDSASSNGHQETERAAPKHTPTPWRVEFARWAPDAPVCGFGIRSDYSHPDLPDGFRMHSIASANLSERAAYTACYSPEEIEANAALIVKAVNTYASNTDELLAAYERIARLEADLHECREHIEQEVDVVDGDYGQPAPNRAMRLVSMIDETLNGPGAV